MKTKTEPTGFVRKKIDSLVTYLCDAITGIWCSQISERTDGGGITVDGVVTFEDSIVSSSTSTTTFAGRLTLNGGAGIGDGTNIRLGTSTGSEIGTSTGQKLGFFAATPVTQQSHIADAQETNTGTDVADLKSELDAVAVVVNNVISLVETLGFTATS